MVRKRIRVRVSPGADRSQWLGRMSDGRLKVRIAAPAEAGKANAALVGFVARCLGVRRTAVRLVSGGSSRDKVLEVDAPAERIEEMMKGDC